MANTFFRFKQFTIHQEKSAMKVGTDGVLLGAWADCSAALNILETGTGTGLMAIMLAQRCPAWIDAVEIDHASCLQAAGNVANSRWKDRISVRKISFQQFSALTNKKYDLIVSNPPFFKDSLKSPLHEKNISKHNDLLPFDDLVNGVKQILNDAGRFSIILPYKEGNDFISLVRNQNLFPIRKTTVYPCPWKTQSRLLIEFGRKETFLQEDSLTVEINRRHEYSEEYKKLTRDFYLEF
ncbi:MAG: methyltransferase [Bacteroidia bacterium]|nr:methyltransferase [Bacteroidia bacterium]